MTWKTSTTSLSPSRPPDGLAERVGRLVGDVVRDTDRGIVSGSTRPAPGSATSVASQQVERGLRVGQQPDRVRTAYAELALVPQGAHGRSHRGPGRGLSSFLCKESVGSALLVGGS